MVTHRLISQAHKGIYSAKVYYESALYEYSVLFYRNGVLMVGSDYFTEDKQDALNTCDYQLKRFAEHQATIEENANNDIDNKATD